MNKKNTLIYSVLVFLFAFSFKLGGVQAYITNASEEVINAFSVASPFTDTYTYVLRGVSGTTTNLGEKVVRAYPGQTINIDAPNVNVSGYTLESITINGSGSYSIGDTYTQPNSNLSIVYTYTSPPRTFSVTFSGENYSHTGGNTVTEGTNYTSTLTANNNYNIDSVTVTMGGNTVQGAYNANTRTVTINNVSGNIVINVTTSGGCLGEGTEIMLWDGSTKKIEDVRYNDLLKVWNHDTGTYGYTYPAYIENLGKTSKYTKVTFSDGTELKVIYDHRIFSKRLNKYVNINSGDLRIGDEVVSLKDGISYVTVVSKEEVEEEINFYNIITTRYFNIIAEGLLVTYEITDDVSSNYKGFTTNMTWASQTPEEEKISYEEFVSTYGYVDKYLYKSLKLEDIRYAITNGLITTDQLASIINDFMMNINYRLTPPTSVDGKYLWMVTTSDDEDPCAKAHQLEEGSTYYVPAPKNKNGFMYWYNSSDNRYYNPGDAIIVDSSMYLEAVYGEVVEEETPVPAEVINTEESVNAFGNPVEGVPVEEIPSEENAESTEEVVETTEGTDKELDAPKEEKKVVVEESSDETEEKEEEVEEVLVEKPEPTPEDKLFSFEKETTEE